MPTYERWTRSPMFEGWACLPTYETFPVWRVVSWPDRSSRCWPVRSALVLAVVGVAPRCPAWPRGSCGADQVVGWLCAGGGRVARRVGQCRGGHGGLIHGMGAHSCCMPIELHAQLATGDFWGTSFWWPGGSGAHMPWCDGANKAWCVMPCLVRGWACGLVHHEVTRGSRLVCWSWGQGDGDLVLRGLLLLDGDSLGVDAQGLHHGLAGLCCTGLGVTLVFAAGLSLWVLGGGFSVSVLRVCVSFCG